MPVEIILIMTMLWVWTLIVLLWVLTFSIYETKEIYWNLPFFGIVAMLAVHSSVRYYQFWTNEASTIVRFIWAAGIFWLVIWIIRLIKKSL